MPTLEELQQDQGFMSATPADQIKFLSATDPAFKSAHPDDQAAFLAHVTKQPTGAEPYAPAKDAKGAMDVASDYWNKAGAVKPGDTGSEAPGSARYIAGQLKKNLMGETSPDASIEEKAASAALQPFKKTGEVLGRLATGAVGMGEQGYHALADAPKDEEEQATENVGSSGLLGRIGGRGVLALKRMAIDPSVDYLGKTQAQEAADKAAGQEHGFTEKAASRVGNLPVLGPFIASEGERAGTGDVLGAAGDIAGMETAGKVAREVPKEFPTVKAGVHKVGTGMRVLGENAADAGAVIGGTVGALKGGPAAGYFGAKGAYYGGKLFGGPLERAGTALEHFGQTAEEKAVTHLEREYKKAESDAQHAQAEYDSYEAGRQAGVPAPTKVLDAHQKAQTHLQLITEHLRLAKEAAEAAKAPVAPDQPIALTPEQEAAQAEKPTPTKEENDKKLSDLMDQAAGAEKPAPVPQNVKLPGQVQPETFPQEPTAAPTVDETSRMRPLSGGKGTMGQMGLPLSEPTPEAPKQPLGEILPPEKKATAAEMAGLKPIGGKVIEAPEKAVAPLVAEGLKKGNAEAKPFAIPPEHAEIHAALSKYEAERPTEEQKPIEELLTKHEAKLPSNYDASKDQIGVREKMAYDDAHPHTVTNKNILEAPEEAKEPGLLGTEKELKNEGISPEDLTKVQDIMSQHSDQDLIRLAKKQGIDTDKYDFAKRDESRHRVERDQLVKDLLEKLPEGDKTNIARLSDEFNKKDTTIWSEAERTPMSKAQRARAIMQEHEGGPKPVSGGSQAADTETVGTKEGAEKDTAFFKQAREANPNGSFSDWAKEAQALKDKSSKDTEFFTKAMDQEIADSHNSNGGSSISKKGSLKDGYSVGINKELEHVVDTDKVTAKDVKEYRERPAVQKALKDNPNAFIGTWADGGKTYFDTSVHVPDLEAAKKLGGDNAQKAIFDLKNKASIDLEPKGVHVPGEAESDEEMARRGADAPKPTSENAKLSDAELLKKGYTQADIDAGAHLPSVSGGAPSAAASKKMLTGEELIKKYGESSGDPAHTAFILPDGRGVDLPAGAVHDEMLGGRTDDKMPPREAFIDQGNIRIRPRSGKGGREFAISIPESGITEDQLAHLKKMAPQMGSGTVTVEVGKPGGDYRQIEYGKASDQLEKTLRELAPVKNEESTGGTPDKSTTGRVNKLGQIVGEAEVTHSKSGMVVVVKPPEGFRAIGDNVGYKSGIATFKYGKYKDFKTPAEAKAAAEEFANDPNNFTAGSKAKSTKLVEEKEPEVEDKGHNAPPENFSHELKPEGRAALRGIGNDSTIIVTPEGAVHHYDEYDPSAEEYTHSSLFNQILSSDKGELGKYQYELEDASPYDPTGNYRKFLDAGGIRAFTTGPTEAGIEIHTKAPAGTIAKALRVADALGREDTTLEVVDPDNRYKTVFSKSGTYEQVKNAVYDWADKNGKEVYSGESNNPTVSGGSPSAATKTAETKLPKLAEQHLLPEEKEGVSKSPQQLQRFVDRMAEMPKVKEWTDAAIAGAGERKWYQRSNQAFDAMSKEAPNYFDQEGDRDKFIGLTAAGSPKQPVVENMKEALRVWTTYVDAGRPTGAALEKLLGQSKAKGGFTLLEAKIPNAMKALAGEPLWPDITKNSNFKVPSFRDNLAGMLHRVTNDGWMALFSGLEAKDISSAHSYHPISVMTRAAADELGWKPAEAQAAIWAFIKTLTEKGTEAAKDPMQIRMYSEDFADIMRHDHETRALLKDMGVPHAELDKRLDAIERKPEPDTSGGRPSAENSLRSTSERVEKLRGKGAIPASKSTGLLNFGEPESAESTSFNPEELEAGKGEVKVSPLSERPNKTILSVKVDGERAGQMSLTPTPDLGANSMEVSTSQLGTAFRGQGHGSEMYKQAIEYAKSKGVKTLFSDDAVSTKADNVWQSLVRKGDAKWDSTTKRYKITISPLGKATK